MQSLRWTIEWFERARLLVTLWARGTAPSTRQDVHDGCVLCGMSETPSNYDLSDIVHCERTKSVARAATYYSIRAPAFCGRRAWSIAVVADHPTSPSQKRLAGGEEGRARSPLTNKRLAEPPHKSVPPGECARERLAYSLIERQHFRRTAGLAATQTLLISIGVSGVGDRCIRESHTIPR